MLICDVSTLKFFFRPTRSADLVGFSFCVALTMYIICVIIEYINGREIIALKDFLKHLNKEQYEAATTIEGSLLIIAGAGSGKTLTLVSRVANMIDEGVEPETILLLTFTNKAAKEMKSRIVKHIGENGEKIYASTFHSFCANFLRRHASLLSIGNDFTIIDGMDAAEVMSIAKTDFITEQEKHGITYSAKEFPTKKELSAIYSYSINNSAKLSEAVMYYELDSYYSEIKEIIKRYVDYKKNHSFFDYDDLLFYTKKILENFENVRIKIGNQYQYVSCDEYQDTNIIQDEILNLICKDHGNLAVVGDDNQSIYKFRGAQIENILTFTQRHPNCKTVVLNQNYRSSQQILDLANSIMEYATEGIPKELCGQFEGERPKLIVTEDTTKEDWKIYDIVRDCHNKGIPYHEIAVIVRSAAQSYGLEALLTKNDIPYEKFGGLKFLEKVVVRDILSFLRLIVNPKDEIALYRILQLYPGIGKTYSNKITAAVAEKGVEELRVLYKNNRFHQYMEELYDVIAELKPKKLQEQLEYLLEEYYPNTIERNIDFSKIKEGDKFEVKRRMFDGIDDAKTLYEMARNYTRTSVFLEDLVLDANALKEETDKLNITTIHSAKGLEYEVVILMDVIEGVTPRCEKGSDQDPEELRCLYVAITRAKKKLYLFVPKAEKFSRNGSLSPTLSHFINYDEVIDCMDKNVSNSELYALRQSIDISDIWS